MVTSTALPLDSSSGDLLQGAAHRENLRLESERRAYRPRPRVHARRMGILLLSVVCRTWLPFMALGLLNRVIGRRIQSIFFCYAGSERYAAHYCYRRTGSILRWVPFDHWFI